MKKCRKSTVFSDTTRNFFFSLENLFSRFPLSPLFVVVVVVFQPSPRHLACLYTPSVLPTSFTCTRRPFSWLSLYLRFFCWCILVNKNSAFVWRRICGGGDGLNWWERGRRGVFFWVELTISGGSSTTRFLHVDYGVAVAKLRKRAAVSTTT